jgi:L-amino acid N-acyltransferase YncA
MAVKIHILPNCVVRSASEADLPAILAIYNEAILNQTSIWNDVPAELAERRAWRQARIAQNYPVLVGEAEEAVCAYASFGDFRPFQGYRYTVEHSVYVAPAMQRRGIGTMLLKRLIADATALGKHVMVGGIAADNRASLALHERLGFTETARMPELGYKFGRWLDLVFVQKML